MNIETYIHRIRYHGPLSADLPTLNALQFAHLQTVPFENLDIPLGRPIRLDLASLYEKIVVNRRGGFCYELNGLFAWLLGELGFQVCLLSASDAHEEGGTFGPDYDHLVLLVQCAAGDEPAGRLVDVGWGDTFLEPLRLDSADLQEQGARAYRIDREEDTYLLWQRDYDGRWEKQYRFTLQPRKFEDFLGMCSYHQTSPNSLFTQHRMCKRATPAGRITLYDARLITTENGQKRERNVLSEDEYQSILRSQFGVDLYLALD